jgi:hypothetical protein
MSNGNTGLMVREPLTPQVWEMISAIGPAMHKSRLFGATSPEAAMAIMLKGHELGLGLTASFEFVQVVEGKPALSPRGALALIQSSPLLAGLKIDDLKDANGKPTGCHVWMKRTNGFEYEVTWTMAEAVAAGVVKAGSGWDHYPANMLRWRAVGFCADVVFPDVLGGMKRADELGANISADGDVIEGTWVTVAESNAPAPTVATVTRKITLSDIVDKYGADAVMAANGGLIPGTDDEVAAIAAKLEASNG